MKIGHFDKYLYNFNFFLIRKIMYIQNLPQITCSSPTITIDFYEEIPDKYFIICYDQTIIIIDEFEFLKIQPIFNGKNLSIHFINANARPHFLQQIQQSKEKLNFQIFEQDSNFEIEINFYQNNWL